MKQFFKSSLLLLICILLGYFGVNAQSKSVNGVVRDAIDNSALPGVNVYVKGGKQATVTDANGNYKINNIMPQDVIVFSFVGYLTKSYPVSQFKTATIDVTLSADVSRLDEVVVVGYGTQKRSEVTGSIGSIKADQMDQFSGGSIATSLQGKIAGLQITGTSGEPGASSNITLRGVSSINGASQPLFIVDGVPVNNDEYSALQDGATFSPLNDLNPADIESIEVLKDAASASIYGSRASNGVIIITTKQGKTEKPVITFTANSSMVNITRTIGVLNGPQFRSAYTDVVKFTPGIVLPGSVSDSIHPYYVNSIDWQNLAYQNTLQYKGDLSISGASKDKNINYYISGSFRDLNPVVIYTKYKQTYGSARVNYKLSKFINGSTNFNISSFDYKRQNTRVISQYLSLFPVYNPYDPITGDLVVSFNGGRINPIAQAIYETNNINRLRYLVKQQFGATIVKGLEFKTNVSYDFSNTESNYFSPPILSTGNTRIPGGQYNPQESSSFVNENTLNYTKKIGGKNKLDFLLGQSYQLFSSNQSLFTGINSVDNVITGIGGTSTITSFSQDNSQHSLLSFFTRANYNYDSKYFLSLVLRADGSSRFGKDNRVAYFPSISSAWSFKKEKFAQNLDWLYDGKLRAGYGVTGNQNIGNYVSQGVISRGTTYLGNPSIVSESLPNKNLKWETTKQLDLGTDLGFLKGRISLTVDYYNKNTSDLLFNVLLPSQSGYGSLPFNFGSLTNKGFDLALSGVVVEKPFSWTTILTFGRNKNKVASLPDNEDYRPNLTSIARVGQPVGVFYGFRALGVYARDEDNVYKIDNNGAPIPYHKGSLTGDVYKAGDVIYKDLNGDGVINDDDQEIIGNPTPDFFGGVQNTFNYKNFNLSFFVNYVVGNQIYNQLRRNTDGSIFDTNYTTDVLRRWRQPGDVTDVPKLVKGDPMQNFASSSRFVEDGSFIRLQNISLGYNLPRKFIKKVGLQSANFGISVQNLLTFGTYSGYDPEVSSGNSALTFGVDNGAFPRTTSYNATLNLKF